MVDVVEEGSQALGAKEGEGDDLDSLLAELGDEGKGAEAAPEPEPATEAAPDEDLKQDDLDSLLAELGDEGQEPQAEAPPETEPATEAARTRT